jgi:hypothetical protein
VCRWLSACMWVPRRVGVCMHIGAYSLANPACNAIAPCCDVFCDPLVSNTFSGLSHHKRCNFRKKLIEYKMCVSIFHTTFMKNISHSKKNLARYSHNMSKRLNVKYPFFLSDLNETWIFQTDFLKKLNHKVSSKSVHWEPSRYMRTDRRTDGRIDGQTDVKNLIVTYRNVANAPINDRQLI